MVSLTVKGHTMTATLTGDIDHHTASQMRSEIDRAVRETPVSLLILDFSRVTFMDSSGIGLVMGRYKLMSELGGEVAIADAPAYISKVMRLSGLNRLCRSVSIAQPIDLTEVTQNAEN